MNHRSVYIFFLSVFMLTQLNAAVPSLSDYDSVSIPLFLPSTLSLQSQKGQLLTFMGAEHTNNPSSSQFATIEATWNKFMKKINTRTDDQHKKAVTVIEISQDCVGMIYSSKKAAIQADCDRGCASWLAHQQNIELIGGDLSHQQIIQKLFSEYEQDHVLYFCFAQALYFWNASGRKEPVEQMVTQFVRSWSGNHSVTFKELVELHKKLVSSSFNPNSSFFTAIMNLDVYSSLVGKVILLFFIHSTFGKKFHEMLKRSHQIRDAHLLTTISSEWNKGNHIFVVYGALHEVALRKPLRQLVKAS